MHSLLPTASRGARLARWVAACALSAVASSAAIRAASAQTKPPPATSTTPQQSAASAQPARTDASVAADLRQEEEPSRPRPPPLNVEYAQYGVALVAEINVDAGAGCPSASKTNTPCIIGSGGGIAIRGGYRSPGPWYFGGAYQFIKMDSSNLYRLGIFQQLRAEMRYLPDFGYRTQPYVSWGAGAAAYGNEWGVETGGAQIFAGAGIEMEVSRVALVGFGFVYRPVLLVGWTDTAEQERDTGIAQFLGLEFLFELRTEMGRK